MKQIIYSIFLISCLAMTTALVSCSKDDDDKVNAPDSLVGTSWLAEDVTEDGTGIGIELDFETVSQVQVAILGATEEVILGIDAGTYNYTYSKPNLTINGEATGVVNGNKLTLKSDGKSVIFTKEED